MHKHLENIMKGISIKQAKDLCHFLLEKSSDLEAAALLTALKVQGHTYETIAGFAKAMKEMAVQLDLPKGDYIDVCGTGGDGINTFNISSTVGLLLSRKMHVTKHGNRSVTSKSGSADLYEALGLDIAKDKEAMEASIQSKAFTFLFAPYAHPNMKRIMPVRKALNFPTIFNIIGPLCNPVDLKYQIVGVYDYKLVEPVSKALIELGIERAAVIHGHQGMDELSTTGPNTVSLIKHGKIEEIIIDPMDYNLSYQSLEDLRGGSPIENAIITKNILNNKDTLRKDIIVLNAGLAFYIGEEASSIQKGVQLAQSLIEESVLKEITCQYLIK